MSSRGLLAGAALAEEEEEGKQGQPEQRAGGRDDGRLLQHPGHPGAPRRQPCKGATSVTPVPSTLIPTGSPPPSLSPTQDAAGGVAGDPQPCAVERRHLDAEFGPRVWQEGFQPAGASVHRPVGGAWPALAR